MAKCDQPRYSVRFVQDNDTEFEECNGEARPLTEEEYAENQYMRDGAPIPYEEYLAYYGNPERHVYLGCVAEQHMICRCCNQTIGPETKAASLWGIDFMDDSPELAAVQLEHEYTPEEVLQLPGYLRIVALEQLSEVGWPIPKHVRCKVKDCKYWHVTEGDGADLTKCAQHQPLTTPMHPDVDRVDPYGRL